MLLSSLAVALGLHWALLSGSDPDPGTTDSGAAPRVTPLDVRTLASMTPQTLAVALPEAPRPKAPLALPARSRAKAPASSSAAGPVVATAAPVVATASIVDDSSPTSALPERTSRADEPLVTAPVDVELVKNVAGPASAEPALSVPVYRTRMPPAAKLHYDMRRGFFSGSGDLVWKPAADGYEVRLQGSVAGLQVLTEVSSGAFDAHGIAPLRYTDTRLRRGTSAANFQRDKGKLSYSGPQVEYPLVPGAQDRVSWMIQIGAVLAANPQLAAPGGRIVFFVSGAQGDADVWAFRYVGAETVRSDDGPLTAVKFTREPRRPYDRLVEVWLAPQRHYLPVRARFTADSDKDAFELLLRDMQAP
jgi:hypothetical protein